MMKAALRGSLFFLRGGRGVFGLPGPNYRKYYL